MDVRVLFRLSHAHSVFQLRRSNGRGPVIGGFALVRQIELLDAAIEAGARDSEQLGGSRLVSARLAHGHLDRSLFDFGQKLVKRLDRARRELAGGKRTARLPRIDAGRSSTATHEPSPAAKSVGMIDDASQLVQVSRPVVARERRDGLGREPRPLSSAALIGALKKMLRQHGQLVAAIAERAQANNQRGQREIEFGPDALARRNASSGSRTVVPISLTWCIERGSQPCLKVARQHEKSP